MWQRTHRATPVLIEVTPSRWDDEPVERARAMLGALVGIGGVSLEWVAENGQVRFLVRAEQARAMARVRTQLQTHFPQALIQEVDTGRAPDRDPLWQGPGEQCAARELRLTRPPALPLRALAAPRGPREREHHDVPLDGMLTAAVRAGAGQRVVGQVVLNAAPAGWSSRLAARRDADQARRPSSGAGPASLATSMEIVPLLLLLALAALGFRALTWYRAGASLPLVLLGAGIAAGLPLLALVAAWVMRTRDAHPAAEQAREKLAGAALAVHLRVVALGRGDADTLGALVEGVVEAACAADHPAGNALHARLWRGNPARLTVPHGPLRGRDILSAAERAGLWLLPQVATPALTPARWRRLLPPPAAVGHGARVGTADHQGLARPVHLPPALLGRNHLIVAKTRRGKSTLLLHLARHLMERTAAGRERLALAVIDPHQDLAEAVLGAVPPGLEDRIVYLNLADQERPVGINLLDPALFPGRDRTAENVVTMLHCLWPDNWGPRMEGALRASTLALHEANQRRAPTDRYTLLDVLPLLTSPVFRAEVRAQLRDPALHVWWEETYERLPRLLQQQTANPITTKIGRFLVGEASRFALGQARSTFDPRALLREGGMLVVNSAVGSLGEGGAALLGATVLNLLGLVVEEQVALPPARRARLVVLVDESSTLGAADYPRMLSELGKYGASFVLVTQSLAKLDALDRQLRPTILANIDALTVFQVSADDARVLTPELGPELASEDLTDLDDYTCYARWWEAGRRLPAFSFQVDPPPAHDEVRAHAVARRSAARYGRPRAEVEQEIGEVVRRRQGGAPAAPAAAPFAGGQSDGGGDATQHDSSTAPQPGDGANPPIANVWRRNHARSNDARRRRGS
jgi:hypothetical protein